MISNAKNIYDSEIECAKYLRNLGYISWLIKYDCGNKYFEIYNDSHNKASEYNFRCINYKCRKKYSIRINSFFYSFPFISLKIISEVIKTFLCIECNLEEAY